MILVCEPSSAGLEHVPVNSAFLAVVAKAFPDEHFVFAAESEHAAAVVRRLPLGLSPRVSVRNFPRQRRNHPLVRRTYGDFCAFWSLFGGLPEAPSRVVLTNALASTLFGLATFVRIRRPKCPIDVVIHGHLGEIARDNASSHFRSFMSLRRGLALGRKVGFEYIVLEECIREGVMEVWPGAESFFHTLEHPLLARPGLPQAPMDGPVRVAYLGVACRRKGFDSFLRLAKRVRAVVGDSVRFDAIGRLAPGYAPGDMDALSTPPTTQMIEEVEYRERLAQVHYVCLLHEPAEHRFSASGVLLDAIEFGKPIICSDAPIFRPIFSRYGDIGDLCKSESELEAALLSLAGAKARERYQAQISGLEKARRERAPEFLASTYRKITEQRSSGKKS